jgi:hypothetical protein
MDIQRACQWHFYLSCCLFGRNSDELINKRLINVLKSENGGFDMEETLNLIHSELQHIDKDQQELMLGQKELIGRIENLEKGHKKLLTSTKNINKVHEELKIGQHQGKILIENLENIKDLLSLGQNEIKDLIKQTTAYMSGSLSASERIIMEIDLLNGSEQQEVLNKINEKVFLRKNNTRWDSGEDDMYDDY